MRFSGLLWTKDQLHVALGTLGATLLGNPKTGKGVKTNKYWWV